MVEDRTLDDISIKVKNFLKHCTCRYLRFKSVEEILTEGTPNVFAIKIIISTPADDVNSISLFKKKDLKDPLLIRRCIEDLRSKIPEKFMEARIVDLQDVDVKSNLLTNFSEVKLPEFFIISKLPYRQLQIECADRRFFIKLSVKSYQRILNVFSKKTEYPLVIKLSELTTVLKRRELITLLIYLKQASLTT